MKRLEKKRFFLEGKYAISFYYLFTKLIPLLFHLFQIFGIKNGNLITFWWSVPLERIRGFLYLLQYADSVL